METETLLLKRHAVPLEQCVSGTPSGGHSDPVLCHRLPDRRVRPHLRTSPPTHEAAAERSTQEASVRLRIHILFCYLQGALET
ncbi:hypothetical protein AVEN_231962-1 [Araneus ventricosus]|uniref:Uncharacterized protein n=1 Tax=Araneus ventricosus TaxID=182803 RepID=A0A4Y2C2F5_ARAVE|nr:hypothetical protein AVEN_231962-1 [Araneus ventricosus]